jgi:hypothetical protein
MRRIQYGVMLLTALLLVCSTTGWSQSKMGTTAAQFLGISVGGRALAMGGTSVASSFDVATIYYNPGAFAQARRSEIMFVNTGWLAGTQFRWFGGMLNIDGFNALGLTITQLDYGEEAVTTESSPEGTGENWSAQDLAIAFSYARCLTDRFSIGGSVKYISQSIWNENASTVAFDVGLLYMTGFNAMRLGMSISNFGGDMSLDGRDLMKRIDIDPTNPGSNKTLMARMKTDPWPIPIFFRVGVSMDIAKNEAYGLTLAADAINPTDNVLTMNVGAEVSLLELAFLRVGYRSLFQKDAEQGLTFGAGVRHDVPGLIGFDFSYAYQKFGLFGNLNTLSVAVQF